MRYHVVERGAFKEIRICDGRVAVARVIDLDDNVKMVSVDCVCTWNLPVTRELSVGSRKLIYYDMSVESESVINVEVVGYESPSRREVILVRALVRNVRDEDVMEIVRPIVIKICKNFDVFIGQVLERCEQRAHELSPHHSAADIGREDEQRRGQGLLRDQQARA